MRHPSTAVDPVDPSRVRTLPAHFAWVDHRLRERLRRSRSASRWAMADELILIVEDNPRNLPRAPGLAGAATPRNRGL
jgi:hypothetical protein